MKHKVKHYSNNKKIEKNAFTSYIIKKIVYNFFFSVTFLTLFVIYPKRTRIQITVVSIKI